MYTKEYERWVNTSLCDADLTSELERIKDNQDEIKDRFAINLSFGTAGLRGVLGAGTNRMNIYTVRKATQGLANYLLQISTSPSVAISYDSRIKSDVFSRETANVLAANNIQVYLYPTLNPVPLLSFAVRQLKTTAGVMITASHNPAKYNGYKVYGSDGCQMTDDGANAVLAEIGNLDIFNDIKTMDFDSALNSGKISYIPQEVNDIYYACAMAESVHPEACKGSELKIVFSPLNGTGNVPVREVLKRAGFANVSVVKEQEAPDGNFPTCTYPNPENKDTLELGIKLAKSTGADIVLATDPDADRVGIAVKDVLGDYKLVSGNEVGVLLLNYLATERKALGTLPQNPVFVKSFVSTPMADAIADKNGVETINVLTGFKYIGEQILLLEQKNEQQRFILAFEESYGYLVGTNVRDKDAVVASLLICEMAAFYATQGTSLLDVLNGLYREYGNYLSKIDSFEFSGLSGMDKMAALMTSFRQNPPQNFAGHAITSVADYLAQSQTDCASGSTAKINLPKSNVLCYVLGNGSRIIVRPSGTEPKIKIYYTAVAETFEKAEKLQLELAEGIAPYML